VSVRCLIALFIVAAGALAGCRDSLPQGLAFASIDAPDVQIGLDGYRRGDRAQMEASAADLSKISEDEMAIGAGVCSREAIAAREASRGASLLQQLLDKGTSDDELVRFAVLEQVLSGLTVDSTNCALDDAIALEQVFPAAVKRSGHAPEIYYAEWRSDLAARLGNRFQSVVDAAEETARESDLRP
jgi:hypothetical protein